eukprot:TRINITY_DN123798_c0_g1_i1.p1 TRINITY_DN123798_c0_g1~~TRINITY_DN123798_c0_g1_i1.p1  ORF type:complete len:507 (-),score=95.31 TRINITY_DN123798_c0_g1_i1:160-1680(-)
MASKSPLASIADPEDAHDGSSSAETSSDDGAEESSQRCRRGGLISAGVGSLLLVAAGAFVYAAEQHGDIDLGPWSDGVSAVEKDGVRMAGRAASKAPEKREMYASVSATPPYCNKSMEVLQVSSPRKIDMPADWEAKCKDYTHVQSSGAWGWPGRNYCWDRVKGKACYGKEQGDPLRNWWWAQEAAWRAGRGVPHPDEVPMHGLSNPQLCDLPQFGAHTQDVSEQERIEARDFVRANMDIYVVNLPFATDRWAAMQGKIHYLGLNVTRIPGVDLTHPGALDKAKEAGLVPKDWSHEAAKQQVYGLMKYTDGDNSKLIVDDWMGIGTVGCAAAHMRAQMVARQLSTETGKPMALILEDDIEFQDDFCVKLHRLLTGGTPCDWQAIALTSRCAYGECVSKHLTRVMPDGNEPDANCHGGVNYGMYAQLYRVSEMQDIHDKLWKKIWNHTNPACLPPDIAMSRIADEIAYYAVPMSQFPGLVEEGKGVSNRLGINGDLESSVQKKKKKE